MSSVSPLLLSISLLLFYSFSACSNKAETESTTSAPESTTSLTVSDQQLAMADSAAMATFKAMSGALSAAMKEGGVKKAVDFCHVEAAPIADSLSKQFGIRISRVSDKPRVPSHGVTDYEQVFMNEYRNAMAQGQPLGHKTYVGGGVPTVYKPIALKGLCLNCHGTPGETLKEENLAFIQSLYPEDKAIGYKEGELRGMWKVEFIGN